MPATPSLLSRQPTTDSSFQPPTPHANSESERRLAQAVTRGVLDRTSPFEVAKRIARLERTAAAGGDSNAPEINEEFVAVDTHLQTILKPLLDACLLPASVCAQPREVLHAVYERLIVLYRSAHLALVAASDDATTPLPSAPDLLQRTILIVTECIGRTPTSIAAAEAAAAHSNAGSKPTAAAGASGIDFHLREALSVVVNALFPRLQPTAEERGKPVQMNSNGEPIVSPAVGAAIAQAVRDITMQLIRSELALSVHLRQCIADCQRNQQQVMSSLPAEAALPPTSNVDRKHGTSSQQPEIATAVTASMRQVIISQCNELENHKMLYLSSQLNARSVRFREFRKAYALKRAPAPAPAAADTAPASTASKPPTAPQRQAPPAPVAALPPKHPKPPAPAVASKSDASPPLGPVDSDGFAIRVLRDVPTSTEIGTDTDGTATEDEPTTDDGGDGSGDDHPPSLGADFAAAPIASGGSSGELSARARRGSGASDSFALFGSVSAAAATPERPAPIRPVPAVKPQPDVKARAPSTEDEVPANDASIFGRSSTDEDEFGAASAVLKAAPANPPAAADANRTGQITANDEARYRDVAARAERLYARQQLVDELEGATDDSAPPPAAMSESRTSKPAAPAPAAQSDDADLISESDFAAAHVPPPRPTDAHSMARSLQHLINNSQLSKPSQPTTASAPVTGSATTSAGVSAAPYAIPKQLAVPSTSHIPGFKISPAAQAKLSAAVEAEQRRFAAQHDPMASADADTELAPPAGGDMIDPDQFDQPRPKSSAAANGRSRLGGAASNKSSDRN